MSSTAIIKTPQEIDNIREAGKHLTELLQKLQADSKPGMTGEDLENIAERYITNNKLTGSFKNYQGFPANLCISTNDCLVHGIPNKTVLRNGDLVKIDCGITYKGGIADSAISLIVGGEHTNPTGAKLIQATKSGLDAGIQYIQPGKRIRDRSNHIHNHIQAEGFSIIRHLTGHGVGNLVHEPPHIYNRPHKSTKKNTFRPGMVVAIEPITAITSEDFFEGKNGWNLYTTQGDLGAQREYTILITENGPEILAGVQ